MVEKKKATSAEHLIEALQERAKELNCLYEVEELLNDSEASVEEIFSGVTAVIPPGWQYPDYCFARISYDGEVFGPDGMRPTEWVLRAPIEVHDRTLGHVEVFYTRELPKEDNGPFLKEEAKLLETIADRVGHFILHKHLRKVIQGWDTARKDLKRQGEWRVIVNLLRRTDQELFLVVARKMMNHLCWKGVVEADDILAQLGSTDRRLGETEDANRPLQRRKAYDILALSEEIFNVAEANLWDTDILELVQKYMQEDRASFLIRTLISLDSTLTDISDAIRRFHHLSLDTMDLAESTRKGVKVAMVRRFLSDQLEFIQIAKDYVDIKDFMQLIPRLIHPINSHGKLGGKSAGMFLAWKMLRKAIDKHPEFSEVRLPKTWYITSDGLHSFLHFNNLEEVTEQKYKDVEQVRQEHPHIVHLFKSSHFPPEIIPGLSMALDDFGESPIIVRSSSLLEDRLGSAFSGKYTSLFLANRGSKTERLEALMDAIAEVYSSTFGSDPIEYRAERGLLDFHEEMGILIQEVVGTRVGKYYLPAYAGVAFSNNEFRWSPRIKREDGLVRLVMGLGTRAVDRLSDDYCILATPGQPSMRVNATVEENIRYSPRSIDAIDLESNTFVTLPLQDFLKQHGEIFPRVQEFVSEIDEDHLRQPGLFDLDFEEKEYAVTFEGLIHNSNFMRHISAVLSTLEQSFKGPVDIEFAHDGKFFYLLQCRPQSHGDDTRPAAIPTDIPESAILFSANRYVSNGAVPEIEYVVYVDPAAYADLEDKKQMLRVARAVGQLNKQLPKRRFILMGPGRWGSRGDIKLGVSVTYSEINNTAMLIEVARQKGNYVPDLSFGTHFFQDLVEASIRYLPLYPDDSKVLFNERILTQSYNMLAELLPEYGDLDKVLKLIHVPRSLSGKILKVYMNADLDQAVAIFTQSTQEAEPESKRSEITTFDIPERSNDDHWRWRFRMAERIAGRTDAKKYGVKAMFIFGSTKNGTARAGSDLDLLVHVADDASHRDELTTWFDGWSAALAEINYLRTGYRSENLLDVHFVTDEDIKNRTSYAVKIGAVTDAAKEIPLGGIDQS
ncbi:nucleotidyltransferase domain-containing protein [bacterium]|nr:nucleotidyltransferase domain-containing protein [bacterium]